jgi:hypothetical protein
MRVPDAQARSKNDSIASNVNSAPRFIQVREGVCEELHCGNVETVTPWHEEWEEVRGMFEAALCDVALLPV